MADVKRCTYEFCRDEYEPGRSSADSPDRFCDDVCESNAAAYASGYGIAEPGPLSVAAGGVYDSLGGFLSDAT
jgi:hypothetical protein